MNLFDFTEEELKLNKRGQVSPRQREWLNMTARGIRSSSWTSVYVTVGFMFLGYVSSWRCTCKMKIRARHYFPIH